MVLYYRHTCYLDNGKIALKNISKLTRACFDLGANYNTELTKRERVLTAEPYQASVGYVNAYLRKMTEHA